VHVALGGVSPGESARRLRVLPGMSTKKLLRVVVADLFGGMPCPVIGRVLREKSTYKMQRASRSSLREYIANIYRSTRTWTALHKEEGRSPAATCSFFETSSYLAIGADVQVASAVLEPGGFVVHLGGRNRRNSLLVLTLRGAPRNSCQYASADIPGCPVTG
jgi:hypothetical protein